MGNHRFGFPQWLRDLGRPAGCWADRWDHCAERVGWFTAVLAPTGDAWVADDKRSLSRGLEQVRVCERLQPAHRLVRQRRDRDRYRDHLADGRESTHWICLEYVYEERGGPTRHAAGGVQEIPGVKLEKAH